MGDDYTTLLIIFGCCCLILFFFYMMIVQPIIEYMNADSSFNGKVLGVSEFKGVTGEWIYIGKNSINTDVFIRKENLKSDGTHKIFERMISNPIAMNVDGDKSSIITRMIDETTGQFKDYKFIAYSRTFCGGKKSVDAELQIDDIPWSTPLVGTFDEYLLNVIKENNEEITTIDKPNVIFS